jgi:hypothetical protein
MHVIIGENRHDADYVARYTLGFEQLAARVQEWTPARAEAITGVPAARIVALARDYAATQPAAIRINYGLQRHYGGGMAVRTSPVCPPLSAPGVDTRRRYPTQRQRAFSPPGQEAVCSALIFLKARDRRGGDKATRRHRLLQSPISNLSISPPHHQHEPSRRRAEP